MKKLSLAIIGGGVAGLTFATKVIRMNNLDIKIF
jgi:protoporphyrinogen oxidase